MKPFARCSSLIVLSLSTFAAAGCGAAPTPPKAVCGTPANAHVPTRSARSGVPAFEKPARYPIAARSGEPFDPGGRSVAIADVDGDGHDDLVAVNPAERSSGVSVLLNRGNGTFRARRDYTTGRGPDAVAAADLDCDGSPDLVTANGGSHSVSVLLSRGGGRFGQHREFQASNTPWAVAIADLDGDGDRDLAVANLNGKPADKGGSLGSVSVLLNDGRGAFADRVNYATDGGYPEDLVAIDVDRDRHLDLAVANSEGDHVYVLRNRGDGRFEPGRRYVNGSGDANLASGDLDGDGTTDLALVWTDMSDELEEEGVTLEPSYVDMFRGRGNGSFAPPHVAFETGGYSELAAAPTVADLDGRSRPDIVFPRDDQDRLIVSALLNDGHGRFRDQDRVDYLIGGGYAEPLVLGDLNGDGVEDLVSANFESSRLLVYLGEPGRCIVQDVSGGTIHAVELTPAEARRALARAGCRLGSITSRPDPYGTRKGRVFAQMPKFGAMLPAGSKVDLVVSSGTG